LDESRTPTYYASGVSFAVTPFDITLTITGREGPTPKDIRNIAHVVLSPQHAYVVSRLLAREVERYEQTMGKIEIPPRLMNDLGLEP
jgi:hypothetical protein